MILISENNSMVNAGIVIVVRDRNVSSTYTGPGEDASEATITTVIESIHDQRRQVLTPPSEAHFLAVINAVNTTDEGRVWERMFFLLTPFFGVKIKQSSHFLAVWCLMGEFMHKIGFILENGKFGRTGSAYNLPEEIRKRWPPVTAWAGPMFEQGSLSTLRYLACEDALVLAR